MLFLTPQMLHSTALIKKKRTFLFTAVLDYSEGGINPPLNDKNCFLTKVLLGRLWALSGKGIKDDVAVKRLPDGKWNKQYLMLNLFFK